MCASVCEEHFWMESKRSWTKTAAGGGKGERGLNEQRERARERKSIISITRLQTNTLCRSVNKQAPETHTHVHTFTHSHTRCLEKLRVSDVFLNTHRSKVTHTHSFINSENEAEILSFTPWPVRHHGALFGKHVTCFYTPQDATKKTALQQERRRKRE